MIDDEVRRLRALAREVADDATLGRLVRVGLLEDAALGWVVRQVAEAQTTGVVGQLPLLRWRGDHAATAQTAEAGLEEVTGALDDWCRRVGAWLESQPDGCWRGTLPELVDAVPGYPEGSLRALGTRCGRMFATGKRRFGFRVLSRDWCGPKAATYTLSSR